MVTDRAVSVLVRHPVDGDLLTFGSDPLGRSLVSVASFVAGALLDV